MPGTFRSFRNRGASAPREAATEPLDAHGTARHLELLDTGGAGGDSYL